MKRYFESLNPSERRLVVGVAVVFFLVVNLVWVRPRFADWGNLQNRMHHADDTMRIRQMKISEASRVRADLEKLQHGGGNVDEEDQAFQLLSTVQRQAIQCGVTLTSTPRQNVHTNQFFVEINQPVSCQAGEKELVDFLYSLGAEDSMIRVAALSVRPDQTRQRLDANVQLLASYQKKPATPSKAAPPGAKTPPGPKVASASQPKK